MPLKGNSNGHKNVGSKTSKKSTGRPNHKKRIPRVPEQKQHTDTAVPMFGSAGGSEMDKT